MKLKEKQRVILIFLYEPCKKKRRKSQEKQRHKNVWVKPSLKNRADSNAYNNLLHTHFFAPEKRKISKNYSFSLNSRILCMNFQTIFL